MTVLSMNNALGHKVIALDTAEQIGEVKSFVVSQNASTIERVQVDGKKKKALFVEWADLNEFGPDALMVSLADAPATSEDDRDIGVAKGNVEILGTRVLDTAGFEHGTVSDVEFNSDDGTIHAVITDSGSTVAAKSIHSLGSYALVVDAG